MIWIKMKVKKKQYFYKKKRLDLNNFINLNEFNLCDTNKDIYQHNDLTV